MSSVPSQVNGVSVRYYQSGQGIGCACDTNLQCIPKTSLHLYTCTSGSALHVLQTLGLAGLTWRLCLSLMCIALSPQHFSPIIFAIIFQNAPSHISMCGVVLSLLECPYIYIYIYHEGLLLPFNVWTYILSMPTLITQWGWVWRYRARVIIAGADNCLPIITGVGMITLILIAFLGAKPR